MKEPEFPKDLIKKFDIEKSPFIKKIFSKPDFPKNSGKSLEDKKVEDIDK